MELPAVLGPLVNQAGGSRLCRRQCRPLPPGRSLNVEGAEFESASGSFKLRVPHDFRRDLLRTDSITLNLLLNCISLPYTS